MHVCRVAATAFKQHPYERVQGAVPFVVRQVVECVGVEEAAANIEGLAGKLLIPAALHDHSQAGL